MGQFESSTLSSIIPNVAPRNSLYNAESVMAAGVTDRLWEIADPLPAARHDRLAGRGGKSRRGVNARQRGS